MKILQVASPSLTLPAKGYGGTQRVVYWLSKALSDLGHEAILAGPKGSVGDGFEVLELLPPSDDHLGDTDMLVLKRKLPLDVDFIHFHCYRQKVKKHFQGGSIPFLCSVHGGSGEVIFRELNTCFASFAQRRNYNFPEAFVQHHPINLEEFTFQEKQGSYLLFLGKPTWAEKGLVIAQKVAASIGRELVVAGPDYSGPGAVGEVWGQRKNDLLGNAHVVLIPSTLPEAFCLVAAEAGACGTPVIAFKSGALSEVVEHGVTGFLADNEMEMAKAVLRIPMLDRRNCRKRVEENFESHLVAWNFLDIYKKICSL